MRIGAERGLAGAADQLRAGGIARQVGAQHEGVDEEADQSLHLGAAPVRHREAEREIGLAGPPRQHRLLRGGERHERRRPQAPGRRGDPVPARGVQSERDLPAARARLRRAGPVGEQRERRHPGQARAPPGELLLQHLAVQPPPLPERKVAVLNRERRQLSAAGEDFQLPRQHADRPAVGGDVMQIQEEDGCASGLEPAGPQQHVPGEIERPLRQRLQAPAQRGVPHSCREAGEIDLWQHRTCRSCDHHLPRLAVHVEKPGA